MTATVLRCATVVVVVFFINVLPAFGPPTWAVLVLFKLNAHLHPAALVALGAVAAAGGRLCLASLTARLRGRLNPQRRESLEALKDAVTGHRGRSALGLALFALSPLPSAQLFEAAGLIGVPLAPVTAVFFAGRVVSYSLYIGAATLAERSLGSTLVSALTSPAGIAVQVLLTGGVVMLARVDWVRLLRHRAASPRTGP
jgi:hypothetical protein